MASRANREHGCKCGNNDQKSLLNYLHDDTAGLLGVFCTKCGREWMAKRYLQNSNSDEFIRFHNTVLLANNRQHATDKTFQVQYNRTRIDNMAFAPDMLKAGDHIQFEKLYYDHHAIVEKVSENSIDIIEYKKVEFYELKVERSTLFFNAQNISNLYRIDHDSSLTDPCDLILARARAWLDQGGYNLLTRNCETFSVYCVIGTLVSWQAICFAGTVCRCILSVVTKTCWKTATKVTFGEVFESAASGAAMSNVVGAGIIILIEGAAIAIDVKKLHSKRQDGGISWKDFLQNTIYRITEGLITSGFVVGGTIFGEIAGGVLGTLICPGVGTVLGMLIGSIIGGVVMAVPGYMIGTSMGRGLGKAIAATVKSDDRLVKFTDLKRGDQIVMCAWFLHPRCHAIVTYIDRYNRTIQVIRNTHAKGVVEEVLDFYPPVYRVIYTDDQRLAVEETIMKARSMIGNKKYNIVNYNCKHFACWCITK